MAKGKSKPAALIPPMGAPEFNKAVTKLGFSQGGIASFVGRDMRTVRRWRSGKYPVPAELAGFLRLMVRFEVKPPVECLAQEDR